MGRINNTHYEDPANTDFHKFFGIAPADEKGDNYGQGYAWLNKHEHSASYYQKSINKVEKGSYGGTYVWTGEILDIKFNQKRRTLEYTLNGSSKGIAFENIPEGR